MRADDEAEFKAYAGARMKGLRRTAFLLCGDWHHADDVVQVVLTKLYINWDRVQKRDRVDSYVRTMLVRATFDRNRRFWWRREVSAAEPPERQVAAGHDRVEERMVLLDALAKMAPRQRAVLVLRFWDDLDVAETAGILGCTEGTVKSQTARGLANLRLLLREEHLMEGLNP